MRHLRDHRLLIVLPLLLVMLVIVPALTMGLTWVRDVGLLSADAVVFASDAPVMDRFMAAAMKGVYGSRIQVCDGTADDVEIQAAIDAVGPSNGSIDMRAGEFSLSASLDLKAYDGVTLRGQGGGLTANTSTRVAATVLAVSDNVNLATVITNTLGGLGYGLHFRDFAIWGNSATQESGDGDGIKVSMEYGSIDGVHIRYMRGNGLEFVGTTLDVQVSNCRISNCTANGIELGASVSDVYFNNVIVGASAIAVRFTGGGSGTYFANSHFYGLGGASTDVNLIYFDGGGTRSRFTNCFIESCDQHAIVLDVTDADIADISFNGCGIFGASQEGANTYDALIVTRDSGAHIMYSLLINGCSFGKVAGNDARYFVNLPSYAYNAVITGCRLNATYIDTACVSDATTGAYKAVIRDNAGWIASGELRTYAVAITAGSENTTTYWQNPFPQNVWITEARVQLTTADNTTDPVYDMAIDTDGSGLPDGAALFTDIPDTAATYWSWSNAYGGAESGVQTGYVQLASNAGTGDWVGLSITTAAGDYVVGTIYITLMGQ
jgi:hypothetical protein